MKFYISKFHHFSRDLPREIETWPADKQWKVVNFACDVFECVAVVALNDIGKETIERE